VDFAFAVCGVGPFGFNRAFAMHWSAAGEDSRHAAGAVLDIADLAARVGSGFGAAVFVDIGLRETHLGGVGRTGFARIFHTFGKWGMLPGHVARDLIEPGLGRLSQGEEGCADEAWDGYEEGSLTPHDSPRTASGPR